VPLLLAPLAASANEPPVPPGPGTTGVTVGLLGPGIDYRLPELKGRLARDGEGELISRDLTDDDSRPFAASGSGTLAAVYLATLAPRAWISVVKERTGDPQAFGHMMSFVTRTPARIVVWLDAAPDRPDWPILAEAAKRFADRLFIIPAAALDVRSYAPLKSPNVLVVAAADPAAASASGTQAADVAVAVPWGSALPPAQNAALIITALAARLLDADGERTMAELKQLIAAAPPKGLASRDGFWHAPAAMTAFTKRN